jgi:Mn2+/Fe2+ NRAMP family transporter
MIMQGFVGFAIPVWLRRLATMLPAFIVVASGADPTSALVLSQVVLSIALPFPMIALVSFTQSTDIMGRFAIAGHPRRGARRDGDRADAQSVPRPAGIRFSRVILMAPIAPETSPTSRLPLKTSADSPS